MKTSLAARKPPELRVVEAAAVPASVVVAVRVVEAWVRAGDRVLVLGATGGVGSHVVQLLKARLRFDDSSPGSSAFADCVQVFLTSRCCQVHCFFST